MLTLSRIPGSFDLRPSSLAAGQSVSDEMWAKILSNADFGAVRKEFFNLGYFQDGDEIPLPRSPVDGYEYQLEECIFDLSMASSRQPAAGFGTGQAKFPALANNDLGAGELIVSPYIFDVIIPVVSGQGSQQKPRLRVQQYFAGSGGAANAGAGGISQATVQV